MFLLPKVMILQKDFFLEEIVVSRYNLSLDKIFDTKVRSYRFLVSSQYLGADLSTLVPHRPEEPVLI